MALTVTYDNTLSRVRASATGLIDAMTVRLERSTDQVRWTTVRGASALTPSSGNISVDDYEFSPDVVNYYRVRGGTVFDDFARTAASSWGNANSGQAWTVVGTASDYAVTSGVGRQTTTTINNLYLSHVDTGATDGQLVVSATVPVVPTGAAISVWVAGRLTDSSNYYLAQISIGTSGAVNVGVGRRVAGALSFLDSVVLSETHSAGNTWRIRFDWTGNTLSGKAWKSTSTEPTDWQVSATDSSLTTGTRAGLLVRRETSNTNGTQNIDFDNLVIDPPEATLASASLTPTLTTVWLKSIARPFLNRPVTVVDVSDISRPARNGVFDVVGRSYPVAVTDVRGSRRHAITVLTETVEDAEAVDLILASGDPVFVHVPAAQNVPGGYMVIGDTSERRFGGQDPRVFEMPMTEVAAPGPDVVGATVEWQSIINDFSTWADVIAEFATWADVLEYIGSASDVIVP